jgi:RHS repeat-associated protein
MLSLTYFLRQRSLRTATISYPLYDAHGNRVSSLSRSGTNGFTYDPVRIYAAWGKVRVGGTTGGSIWRYYASLGHVQDDESGLVYMRARYFEPSSGRCISEDPQKQGSNWFAYCGNSPVNCIDRSGKMFTLFDLGITLSEILRTRASQAAALATASSKCGDKVSQTMAKYNFRMELLMDIEDVSFRVGEGHLESFDEVEQALMVGNWDKVNATFTGTDQ